MLQDLVQVDDLEVDHSSDLVGSYDLSDAALLSPKPLEVNLGLQDLFDHSVDDLSDPSLHHAIDGILAVLPRGRGIG